MKIWFIFVALNFSTKLAWSAVDTTFSTLARSHAAAASVAFNIGYGQKIWGEDPILYGFVRPYIVAGASPSSYEGRLGVEIFPVSFLGVDIKKVYNRRFSKPQLEICDTTQCLGEASFTDVSLQIYLGYQSYFASVRWTRSFFDSTADRTKPKYDLGSSVLISPASDTGDYFTYSFGQKGRWLLSDLNFGLYFQDNYFQGFGQRQQSGYLFVQKDLSDSTSDKESSKKSITGAVGVYDSSETTPELSLVVSFSFSPKIAIGLGR